VRNKRRIQGLTLIEVLVTSALFTVLLGLVSQFFVVQSRAASLQKALNEANEGTRIALSLITWDLQNAGYGVTLSSTNPAFINATNGGHKDIVTTRFFDEDLVVPAPQKVRYDIAQGSGEIVSSLRRAKFADNLLDPPTGQGMRAAVASMVAFNVRFETRQDPFATPTVSGCATGTTPIPEGATGAAITNCRIDWVWADTPQRLVRSVKVQLLGRSETRVSNYTSPVQSYTFEGGSQYVTEPGFVYHFAEQTVLVPNLGR
jgi:prepilin-type N-terminal cleavage/methylation domain-containing protein